MKTLVVGLGNPILTDDGVGVKAAFEIEAQLSEEERQSIAITEASVGGLRLMELMIGYERVILIDAIQHTNGYKHPTGTIFTLSADDLRNISPTQHSASAHDTSLITALEMAKRIGMPIPREISIYAVEVENILEFNDQPTPAVAAAIPKVTAMVLEELRLSPKSSG